MTLVLRSKSSEGNIDLNMPSFYKLLSNRLMMIIIGVSILASFLLDSWSTYYSHLYGPLPSLCSVERNESSRVKRYPGPQVDFQDKACVTLFSRDGNLTRGIRLVCTCDSTPMTQIPPPIIWTWLVSQNPPISSSFSGKCLLLTGTWTWYLVQKTTCRIRMQIQRLVCIPVVL